MPRSKTERKLYPLRKTKWQSYGPKAIFALHIWLQVSDDHVKLPKPSQNQICRHSHMRRSPPNLVCLQDMNIADSHE